MSRRLHAQGSVLYNNYGFKSNEELLLAYGFMLPENMADFFHITLSIGTTAAGMPLILLIALSPFSRRKGQFLVALNGHSRII